MLMLSIRAWFLNPEAMGVVLHFRDDSLLDEREQHLFWRNVETDEDGLPGLGAQLLRQRVGADVVVCAEK